MSIEKIFPEDIDVVSVETNVKRVFSSSSLGTTGSVYLFPRRSLREKEVFPLSYSSASRVSDVNLHDSLKLAKSASLSRKNNNPQLSSYLTLINSQSISARKQQKLEILRYTPFYDLDWVMLTKQNIVENLLPYYRPQHPSMHYGFTNYHCLNFFTSSAVATDTAILYPLQNVVLSNNIVKSGSYVVTGAFSFDFWINPKYTNDNENSVFRAGTILHLSSCYAISLVSGSSRDANGFVDGFRILFQVSGAAELAPSSLNMQALPQFAFVSADNALKRNNWHHITIRWGGGEYDFGSGSILVDSTRSLNFSIPSQSLQNRILAGSDGPTVLFVGNFYEGSNTTTNSISRFFTTDVSTREGLIELVSVSGVELPGAYTLNHPLNAEIHDLKIYNKFLSDREVESLGNEGTSLTTGLLFYVPPFFTRESPTRTVLSGKGGIFKTPFQTYNGTTTKPFSAEMSFEVCGHYMNLENFGREFVNGVYPRFLGLSASQQTAPQQIPATANQILYASASVRKRNLTILPCDNGQFVPNFQLLKTLQTQEFVNDLGNLDLSLVTIKNMISTSSIYKGLHLSRTGSIANGVIGPNPSDSSTLGNSVGTVPSVLQKTRDNNSNQIRIFDISNLFYGNYIRPGSLRIFDSSVSSSGGKISFELRDDGMGNLYRASAATKNSSWNSVGNVFYNEGIVLVKNPSLYFIGETQYSIEFSGSHDLHVMTVDCTARSMHETSSSNQSFLPFSASNLANVTDNNYVWISDVLLHDDNLNVVARTTLAQPILKRSTEKIVFRKKIDF